MQRVACLLFNFSIVNYAAKKAADIQPLIYLTYLQLGKNQHLKIACKGTNNFYTNQINRKKCYVFSMEKRKTYRVI